MSLTLKKEGYFVRILTWGMAVPEKQEYLARTQNGCPLFWHFIAQFFYSFAGLRRYKEPVIKERAKPTFLTEAEQKKLQKSEKRNNCIGLFCYASLYLGGAGIVFLEHGLWKMLLYLAGVPLAFVLAIALLCAVLWLLFRFIETESADFMYHWFKAKKDKVCPMVTFE